MEQKPNNIDALDFIQGQKDCRDNGEAKENMSESYYRGFAAQYQLEQNMSELSYGC